MAAVTVRAKGKKKSSYVRVGTGFANEAKFRAKLRGNTGDPTTLEPDGVMLPAVNPDTGARRTYLPSDTWADEHFPEIDDVDADGNKISVRYFQRNVKTSPLNGATPGAIRCERCGRLCSPQAIEGGVCLDHRPRHIHEAHGGSPSARAIQELQHRNLRMEEKKMKPESKSSLRREIKRFKQGKWKPRS